MRLTNAPDPLQHVARALSVAPYAIQARILVHAPAEEVIDRVPPDAGVVEPADDGCLLTTGSDDLDTLVAHLVMLGLPFTVIDPPALREWVATVAARLSAASSTG
ncbi:hypothetical protein BH23ACT9_BH23ACT9_22310 [soil metagenome]